MLLTQIKISATFYSASYAIYSITQIIIIQTITQHPTPSFIL